MDVFKEKYSRWSELEKKISALPTEKLKGDAFEFFVHFYFLYFKEMYQIKELYCPVVEGKPFPQKIIEKLKLENTDHGVDGVFVDGDGAVTGWQAKFRSGRGNLTYKELSTFWAEAEYADYRMIVSNTISLPTVSIKKKGHLSILVDKFDALDAEFFSSLFHYHTKQDSAPILQRKSPRDYQQKILSDIEIGFQHASKGKVIAACGIGKTLIALWAVQAQEAKRVIFFAPSLQLIRQTLQEWSIESQRHFKYICVCSDQTVDAEIDSNNISENDIDIPITTDSTKIKEFFGKSLSDDVLFIFSTYQSAAVVSDAIKSIPDFSFDFAIYDEAHRTAGVGNDNKFSVALEDSVLPSKHKLFLTATERLVRPKLSKNAEDLGQTVFSMDDKKTYGEVFHRLTFGEAIEKKIIADYRIVFTGITSQEMASMVEKNLYVTEHEGDKKQTIQNLYKLVLLKKAIADIGLTKIISFHSKISEAQNFANVLKEDLIKQDSESFVAHINGAMSAQIRASIIHNFENSTTGVISNVRCLTEGIDIPMIDAVFFADPKGSMIDIVQAVGRALRQKYGEAGKTAYIIIPVLLDEASGDLLSGQGFEALFNLIQALRDQDHQLAEWIDAINIGAVKGRASKPSSEIGKISIHLPTSINLEDFEKSLLLKIAEVNKNPTGTIGVGSKLGKKERKGDFTRVFKTLCDYTPEKLEESLIKPTFEKIVDADALYAADDLRINNNNISHCKRVGLIEEISPKTYQLTPLGLLYKNSEFSLHDILRNQFLLYREEINESILFPYREAFLFFREIKKVNYIQFLYSLYSIQFDSEGKPETAVAIEKAKLIAEKYPNILVTSEANKPIILEELNQLHPTGFSFNNVWTDRTTTGNQYRYLMRHLELYGDIFAPDGKNFLIKPGSEALIDRLLAKSEDALHQKYGHVIWIS